MPGREEGTAVRRRRRTPEVAQREIIDAAEGFLRERPFRELTVDEVMRRTGLSRPSFYVYFKDRNELVLRLVQHLQAELLEMANRWLQFVGGGPDRLRDALVGVVEVYGRHGAVLRALADAAVDDPEVEAVYGALVDGFVALVAQHVAAEVETGDIAPLDPGESAKALVWMAERYLYLANGPTRRVPDEVAAETLASLWTRALYPTS